MLRLYVARALQVASRPKVRAVRSLSRRAAASPSRAASSNRRPFPASATARLKRWFVAHLSSPYPSEKQKGRLSRVTGMAVDQVANWWAQQSISQLPHALRRAVY